MDNIFWPRQGNEILAAVILCKASELTYFEMLDKRRMAVNASATHLPVIDASFLLYIRIPTQKFFLKTHEELTKI